MKIEVFSSYSDSELYEKLHELRVEVFNLKINKRFVSKSELGKISVAKRSVARILTVINKRKLLSC